MNAINMTTRNGSTVNLNWRSNGAMDWMVINQSLSVTLLFL